MSLTTTIKSIQDIMRKDVGVDGDAQRIGQLVWMLFLKIYDDRESEQELMDEKFVSVIPEPLRWRSWAADDEASRATSCSTSPTRSSSPSSRNSAPKAPATIAPSSCARSSATPTTT